MRTYVIGDLQGCLEPLKSLLKKIQFEPQRDHLWLTGDLINRGPQSLDTLRFVYNLPNCTAVLGNHDLTCIAAYYGVITPTAKDTYTEILTAPDSGTLIDWLCQKPLLHHDETLRAVLVHAGIYPRWNLQQAKAYALECEFVLKHKRMTFLAHMYGNEPSLWQEDLTGWDRIRFITNAFTRMRFCHEAGRLDLNYKGGFEQAPKHLYPWFSLPNRQIIPENILFGHWAALEGKCHADNIFALDSGCVWGNALTAMCLETGERFQVSCQKIITQ